MRTLYGKMCLFFPKRIQSAAEMNALAREAVRACRVIERQSVHLNCRILGSHDYGISLTRRESPFTVFMVIDEFFKANPGFIDLIDREEFIRTHLSSSYISSESLRYRTESLQNPRRHIRIYGGYAFLEDVDHPVDAAMVSLSSRIIRSSTVSHTKVIVLDRPLAVIYPKEENQAPPQIPEEENQESAQAGEPVCHICMDKPACCLFVACKHVFACVSCCRMILLDPDERKRICSICRTPNKEAIRVYI